MVAAAARPAIPARITIAVTAVVILALALLPLSARAAGVSGGAAAAFQALVLAGLIALAHRRPVALGPKRKTNASTAPAVAAVLLLPGPLAALVLAVGTLLGEATPGVRLVQRVFNTAVAVIRATAGAVVYAAVGALPPAAVSDVAAPLAAATVMYGSTLLLVGGIVAVQTRTPPRWRTLRPPRTLVLAEAALSLTGILTALAAADHAWAVLLLLAPAVLGVQALHTAAVLRDNATLAHQATHDPLTDLPNRRLFTEQLAEYLAAARDGTAGGAVLLVDLDWFKPVNDRFGHAVGDAVLCAVAARLQTSLPPPALVARLSGDEFAALLPSTGPPIAAVADVTAAQLLARLGEPMTVGGAHVCITASIGISLFPVDGDDAATLLHHADRALYAAKAAGRNTAHRSTPAFADA